MRMRISDAALRHKYQEEGVALTTRYVPFQGDHVRYVVAGDTTRPATVLFVHGAPGSLDEFTPYLTHAPLLAEARLISMDRPGYGGSDYGHPAPDLATQVAALWAVVEREHPGRLVLVGHSYGGPIVAQFALDHPGQTDGVVLLAPALDPAQERAVWLGRFGTWVPFRWLVSGALRVSSYEKVAHREELRQLLPRWEAWDTPLAYFHGERDFIVPYGNMEFAQLHLMPADSSWARFISLPNERHFLQSRPLAPVVNEIQRLLAPPK